MKITWPLYAGAGAQALPLIAALYRRFRLSRGQWWTVAWAGGLVLFEALTLWLALLNRNNHLWNYLFTPLVTSMALWALSTWQNSPRSAVMLRFLIPLLAVGWVAMVVAIESIRTFSLLAEPFAALLLLSAAIWTVLTRAIREEGSLSRQEWMWISIGIALYAATSVAFPPVSYLLVEVSPNLVMRALEGKSLSDVVAFALIARGVLQVSSDD